MAVACNYLPNAQEAEDVVQESMVKLWEDKKELSHYQSVQAWLYRVVRNRCLDLLKRKGRNHSDVNDQQQLMSYSATPEDDLHHSETLCYIKSAIAELPETQRQLFELRQREEMSYEELSAATGLDMSKVKVYLHRARKALKQKLEQRERYGLQSA